MNKGEVHKTKLNDIWIDDEGILWIVPNESGELDLEETTACFDIYKKLGLDKKKVLQIMDLRNSVTMSKEARDYAASQGYNYFIASACVSDSLAVRLMVNFFNKFYSNKVPFKMFGDIESAKKWLQTFKK